MKLFTDHPASVGESYFEHMRAALCFSGRMLLGGLVCFIHGILPFCFKKTGGNQIRFLHDRMVVHRSKSVLMNDRDEHLADRSRTRDRQI